MFNENIYHHNNKYYQKLIHYHAGVKTIKHVQLDNINKYLLNLTTDYEYQQDY